MSERPATTSDNDVMDLGLLARLYEKREASVAEVVEEALRRIDARNTELGAFITVLHDEALARAAVLDREGWSSERPLFGVPIGIKDLADYKAGVRNTYGTTVLADYVPEVSSLHVQRLEDAGAVVVGKTNVPEFGHKGVTDNAIVGPARLPDDLRYNAGGSSGGSASAVAAGLVPIAQGSDGGGSVRIPAALCGLVGYKATFGRIPALSRPNAFVGDRPFVAVGPLARTVQDAAVMTDVLSGRYAPDPWSYEVHDRLSESTGAPTGLRVAYCRSFGDFPVEPAVTGAIRGAVHQLRSAGIDIDEIDLDLRAGHQDLAAAWVRQIALTYLGTIDALAADGRDIWSRRSELCGDMQNILDIGEAYDLTGMRRDDELRTLVLDAFEAALGRYDILLTPTNAVAAVANAADGTTVGPSQVSGAEVDPLIGWCLTYPVNFTGHPAASVPVPSEGDGHVGLQLIGRRYRDIDVVSFGRQVETAFKGQSTASSRPA